MKVVTENGYRTLIPDEGKHIAPADKSDVYTGNVHLGSKADIANFIEVTQDEKEAIELDIFGEVMP